MISDFPTLVKPTMLMKPENSYGKNSLVNTSRFTSTLFAHARVNLKNASVLQFVMEARTCRVSVDRHFTYDFNELNVLVVGISQNNSSRRV